MNNRFLGIVLAVVVSVLGGSLFFVLFQNQKELAATISVLDARERHESVPQEVKIIEKVVAQQPWGPVQVKAKDTVVQILSQIAETNILKPYETPQSNAASGSGFFISSEGEIITNMHVVDQAKCVWIKIPALGKAIVEVEVIGRCPERDLALLKVTPEGMKTIGATLKKIPYLVLADSDFVNRADEVLALGYPLGQASLKSTSGVVSGREHMGGRHYIQISSPINPGSSGGPAVNLDGEVIGITCAGIMGAQNVGYIIPVNELKLILPDLRIKQLIKKPYLGVLVSNGSEDLALNEGNPLPSGCYVVDVYPKGPLDKAGVKAGDMIYEINKIAVDEYGDLQVPWSEEKISFVDYISRWQVGEKVEMLIYRHGKPKQIFFTFGQTDLSPIKKIFVGDDVIEYEIFGGMLIQPLTLNHVQILIQAVPTLIKYVEYKNQIDPVLIITHVVPGSQLDRLSRIREGCIITHVNNEPVKTMEQYRKALQSAVNKERVTFKTAEGVVFVLNVKKVFAEEEKLARLYHYPISPFVQDLLKSKSV
jgi:serine protease Do